MIRWRLPVALSVALPIAVPCGLAACLLLAALPALSGQSAAAALDRSTPYLLGGIGVALCFRAAVINNGAERQIAVGGLAAVAASLAWPVRDPWLAIPWALCMGALAGAGWAGCAAILHLGRGVHEVLATLLLNFVALLLVQLLLAGGLGEPGAGFLQTAPIPRAARLPRLPGLGAHLGFPLALAAAALGSMLLWRTRFGFGLRVLGASPQACRYAGFDVKRLTAGVMLLAGGLAGLGGAVEALGLHRRLVEGFSLGFGFRAVTVALLGLLEPLAVVPAALFVGLLETAAQAMQRQTGLPSSLVTVLEGLTVLLVLAATARRRRI